MKAPHLALMLTVVAASAIFALYHDVSARVDEVRIVSPRNGEVLSGNSVAVRYQAHRPGDDISSAGYELLLDGNPPVRTQATEYIFQRISPGRHQLHVRAPAIRGTEHPATSAVSFSTSEKSALPETGSALPLLSVIGFGVLLGGLASALKTR